ncbi:hypothetical protein FRC09_015222 [Ceratobasidium sp. 395]|nr:hypothetical protein FRC09_015222 [Ceratobasidium sp. 395]
MSSMKRKAAPDPIPSNSSRTKQRKLPNTSNDTQLLLQIINKSEESKLRSALASSVNAASPSDLQAIKRYLGPLVTWSRNPRHCVRCHESYIEGENASDSCQIRHEKAEYCGDNVSDNYPYDEEESYNSDNEYCERMRYRCCGKRWREGKEEELDGVCVQEYHTTDPAKVYYFRDPSEEEEDDWFLKWRIQNRRVVTCEQNGCYADL